MPTPDDTTAFYDTTAEQFAARTMGIRLHSLEPFRAALQPGALVLDLGCGPGRDSHWLHGLGVRAVGLDLSAELLRLAQRHHPSGQWVRSDMRRLPFPTGTFDGVWFCASLLHISRAEAPAVLAEVRRICRPGAVLQLAVQRGESERWFPESGAGRRFFCFWQPDQLRDAVEAAGFNARGMEDDEHSTRPGLHWLSLQGHAS